jgi:hypothetical protein
LHQAAVAWPQLCWQWKRQQQVPAYHTKYVMQAKVATPIANATTASTKLNKGVRETRSRFTSRMPIVRRAALPDSSLIAREPSAYLAELAAT